MLAGWCLMSKLCWVQPADVQYAQLGDGRNLCLECLETAVLDTKACQPLYREILNFYKTLGMRIDQEIPMLLVERSALNAAREGEKDVSFLVHFGTSKFNHLTGLLSVC